MFRGRFAGNILWEIYDSESPNVFACGQIGKFMTQNLPMYVPVFSCTYIQLACVYVHTYIHTYYRVTL